MIPATTVAFMAFFAFKALKHQNMEIMTSLIPNQPQNTKKEFHLICLPLWPSKWPWQPLLAFYIFLQSLKPNKASGTKNRIFQQSFIYKGNK